ncbi:rhodanese-like domain-containing protein [Hyunsoonleella rubra]|uniref:Rhodanese-like domain-containing protein n=1 Tax=Hyunsoonleella rubra TaxID=1737062 RepID=A0ABW5TBS6_9FLAO
MMKQLSFLGILMLVSIISGCQVNSGNSEVLKPSVFKDSISKENIQLIDVRKPKEFKEFHIPGAININYFSDYFLDSLKVLNPEGSVFIYCRSGKRSSKSVKQFEKAGFDKIYQLEGGLVEWKSNAFPTVSE